jgi:succinate dehydrogenase assembly factor 1
MQGQSPPTVSTRPSDPYRRREFQRNKAVDKKDFAAVEFLLRMGNRRLEMYSDPGITNIH